MKKTHWVLTLVLLILIIDQAVKIWIKTTFCYGEEHLILGQSWARLNFVENPGMAFGWALDGEYGKLLLSVFRLIAIGLLIYYVRSLIKKNVSTGLLASFSLILAGAIGNMIDSAFYGLIFTNSDYHCAAGPAKFVAMGQGYAGFLHGKVVDMFFFPIWRDDTGSVLFFQPVFNVADSAITIGVLSILLFHRRYFSGKDDESTPTNAAATEGVAVATGAADSITVASENEPSTEDVTEVENNQVESPDEPK